MTVPIWLQNTVEVEWRRVRTVVSNQSPFTGQVFQSSYPDSRWTARITYADMTRAEAAPLLAAIAAQRDGIGTFGLFDPDFGVPRSGFAGSGNIGVSPAFGALTLLCSGFPVSTLLTQPADKMWINYGSGVYRMCEVTGAVISNGIGDAAIPIDELPFPLPTSGMTVGFNWLGGQSIPMRLINHQRQSLPGARFRISIEAEERV